MTAVEPIEARLMRLDPGAPGRPRAPFGRPREIARGALPALIALVREEDCEEWWRYTILSDDAAPLRGADLRARLREPG
ncbi:hypothetical protein [Sphingomonas morindae]|uniref:Uncharacterized protein n=1 Tax=Sphingomonas morindae TaxID=1541170 RepID=A0ABY4XDY7_9SPHN|nr:hypothetical protein [Sphingomonas morindae]USI74931.1 hypothetical protein LHA26_17315 [Sphingomonas morindae]